MILSLEKQHISQQILVRKRLKVMLTKIIVKIWRLSITHKLAHKLTHKLTLG